MLQICTSFSYNATTFLQTLLIYTRILRYACNGLKCPLYCNEIPASYSLCCCRILNLFFFQFLRIYPQWYCTFYPSHYFRREGCLLSKSLFLMNFCAPFNVGFPTCSYWQLTENSSICVLCLFRLKQGSILQMWLKLRTFMNQSILQVPSALKWFPENKHRVTIPHISIAVPQTHLSCWQINA